MLQIARIVEAGRLDGSRRLEPWPHRARGAEPFCSARERKTGAHLVEDFACDIAPRQADAWIAKARPKPARIHLRPKLTQPPDPGIRRIASDDGPVDRPD